MGLQEKLQSLVGDLCTLSWVTEAIRMNFEMIQILYPHHAFVFRIAVKDKSGLDSRFIGQGCGDCIHSIASNEGMMGSAAVSKGTTDLTLTLVDLSMCGEDTSIQLPLSGFTAIYFYSTWREKVFVSKQIDINLRPSQEQWRKMVEAKKVRIHKDQNDKLGAPKSEEDDVKVTEIRD